MDYAILDNDELIRLALEAMNNGKDADSVVMLKTLVDRDPGNGFANYLLAAQHAQMGLMDRAEAGFRAAIASDVELPTARFQLGQLLALKGDSAGAVQVLQPLAANDDSLGAYARGISAAALDDIDTAIRELDHGLSLPQDIPALATDMRNLRERFLAANAGTTASPAAETMAPRFLGAYRDNG